MASSKKLLVFVHGWSVTDTGTYGQLPACLKSVARGDVDVKHIWLGKYISFHDEVRFPDISKAFESAVHKELRKPISQGRRFICITHSTGGPVIRDWLDRYYIKQKKLKSCPMSHLIMLAPANFGSALAQLGRSSLNRIRTWFEDIEPGKGVLDWLELGSSESWELNKRLFGYPKAMISGENPVFQFVLTGQQIDRKLYDIVNNYTGELGSDGVIRAAAANLNSTYIRLEQSEPVLIGRGQYEAPVLQMTESKSTNPIAFALIKGRSHSGDKMGIMRSVRKNDKNHPTVKAILSCIGVSDKVSYEAVCEKFAALTEKVERDEIYERCGSLLRRDSHFIHDPHSMVIFRVCDDEGYAIEDFDLLLTTGPRNDANKLPSGFFRDRQRNSYHKGTVTYYLNHSVMAGTNVSVKDRRGKRVRGRLEGMNSLGFKLSPHMTEGFVHYLDAELAAKKKLVESFLKPHQTTMVEVVLKRVVRSGVFKLTRELDAKSFKKQKPGKPVK